MLTTFSYGNLVTMIRVYPSIGKGSNSNLQFWSSQSQLKLLQFNQRQWCPAVPEFNLHTHRDGLSTVEHVILPLPAYQSNMK